MFLFLNSSEKITDPRLEKTGFEIFPLYVAKCNLGKVKFKTMPVSGRPTLRLRGDLLSSLLGVPRGLLCICLLAGLCERSFC